jgi:hypothetical protein
MADTVEPQTEAYPGEKGTHEAIVNEAWTPDQLPEGWMYRRRGKLPWYASPAIQLGLVAFVCFLCPGMFNALGGLGGGGKTDTSLADDMVSCTNRPRQIPPF